MMTSIYSCPKCKKNISLAKDSSYISLLFVLESFLINKCPFCGTKISVNWSGYFLNIVIHFAILGFFFLIGFSLLSGASGKNQTLIGIIIFATFLPFGMIFFWVILPWLIERKGYRFYVENN